MEALLQEITPWVTQYGLWIVFFGMMVEGTTMILATGILCYLGMLPLQSAIPVAILGATLGDQLWYALGRRYMQAILDRFPSLGERVGRMGAKVRHKGDILAFSSRFLYSGAILFPLALGYYRYPWRRFTLLDLLGVGLWATTGVLLGYLLGTGVEQLFGEIKKVEHLLLVLVLVGLGAWQTRRYFTNRKRDT